MEAERLISFSDLPNEMLLHIIDSIPCHYDLREEYGEMWYAILLTCKTFWRLGSPIFRRKVIDSMSGEWLGTLGWRRWAGKEISWEDHKQSMKPNFKFKFDSSTYLSSYLEHSPSSSSDQKDRKPYATVAADENRNEGIIPQF